MKEERGKEEKLVRVFFSPLPLGTEKVEQTLWNSNGEKVMVQK